MSGTISLESAIRTCKVNTGWANRVESDRFHNPNEMMCPIWTGVDTAGRPVHPDTFMTKSGGCNSALDRIDVENNVWRPQYMEYVTLSANGIKGDFYGRGVTMSKYNSKLRTDELDTVDDSTGNFGLQFGASIQPSCGYAPYKNAAAMESTDNRYAQAYQSGTRACGIRRASGL